jgi:hypothetical protein
MNFAALPGFLGRATITAIVVVLASVIAEVARPVLGGLAASLPVSGGPTYIFLALTHNASFVSASALSSFAANAATIAFLATYARLAPGRSRLAALVPPIVSWLILALLIRGIQWTAVTAAILNAGVLVGGILVTRQTLKMDRAVQPRARPICHWRDSQLPDRIHHADLPLAPSSRRRSVRDSRSNGTSSNGWIWADVPRGTPNGRSTRPSCGTFARSADNGDLVCGACLSPSSTWLIGWLRPHSLSAVQSAISAACRYAVVKEKHGHIDILFANAGAGTIAPLAVATEGHFDQTFDVNVKGMFFTVQKALPLFKDGGSIIL